MAEPAPQPTPDPSPAPPPVSSTGQPGSPAPASSEAPAAPQPASAPPAGVAQRPEEIPAKFWDAAKGEPRTLEMGKSYGELEKQRNKVAETAAAAERDRYSTELFGKRPTAPEDYGLAAPDTAPDVVILSGPQPDGFAPEPGKTYLPLDPSSKALGQLRQMAHRAGASAEEFQGLLVEFARENGVRAPTEAEAQADRERVYASMGEHGQRRVQHLYGSMRTILGDRAGALDALVQDKAAIEALEELTARATGSRFAPPAPGTTTPNGPLTEKAIKEKMNDPRYYRDKDPAYMREIERDWKTLYPN